MVESQASTGHRIVKGMFVVIFFGLFVKLGGFLMTLLVSRYYGLGDVTASYMQVYNTVIYLVVYSTILKVVQPALMPVFSESFETQGEGEAWKLASTVLNGVLVAGVLLSIGAFFFADLTIETLAPGFEGPRRMIAANMLRGMSPGVLVFAFAVVAMAILNSYKVFSYPAAAEAAQKLCWVLALFILMALWKARDTAPSRPIVVGFLCGCVAQVAVLLYGMRRQRRLYRFGFPGVSARRLLIEGLCLAGFAAVFGAWAFAVHDGRWLPAPLAEKLRKNASFAILTGALVVGWAYAGWLWWRARGSQSVLGRLGVLVAPMLIGVLFARYRDLVQAYFQSYTEGPDFAAIELGKRVANLPTVVVAYSLSIAMLPYLCDLAARRDYEHIGRLFGRTVRMIALFFVPLTIFLVVCGRPTMQLFFDSGVWSETDARKAGMALAIYSSGLFFYAVENVLMQTFISIQRVGVPTFLGILMAVVHVAFLTLMIQVAGFSRPEEIFFVVLVSFPLTRFLKNALLMVLIYRRIGGGSVRGGLAFLGRLAILTALVGGAALGGYLPSTRVVRPARFKGVEVMLDTFNPEDEAAAARARPGPGGGRGIAYWAALPGCSMRVDTLEKSNVRAECALLFPGRVGAARRLEGASLDGVTRFRFKAMTTLPRQLVVEFRERSGRVHRKSVTIRQSKDRKPYVMDLTEFEAPGAPLRAGELAEVAFLEAAPPADPAAKLWLDSVLFDKPTRRILYELAKMVVLGVPGLAALAAFVAGCVVLRVEEFQAIVQWVRERGWRRARKPKPRDQVPDATAL